jgi:hypothetical protein
LGFFKNLHEGSKRKLSCLKETVIKQGMLNRNTIGRKIKKTIFAAIRLNRMSEISYTIPVLK